MTRSNDEDPLERLRAADPAVDGAAPDRNRIRAAVDRRLAETAGAPESTGPDPAPGVHGVMADAHDRADEHPRAAGQDEHPGAAEHRSADELAARRRRRRPLRYAAAAVGAVLLLGGGYTIGAESGGLAGSADLAAGGQAEEEQASSQASPESAPAPESAGGDESEPDSSGGQDASGEQQRTVFTAGDLPAGPARGQVYALDVAAGQAEARATDLAAALGLDEAPQEQDGTWVVGAGDGSTPMLRLYPDGTMEYADPELYPWTCLPAEPPTDPGSTGEPGAGEEPGATGEPGATIEPDEGGAPSGPADCADAEVPAPADAAETFAAFLDDAGLVADRYEIRTEDAAVGARVTATLLLDGQQSQVSVAGILVPGGIAAAWGLPATATDLGEYPLISPTDAVQRLMDPKFSGGADVITVPGPRFAGDQSNGVVATPDPRFSGPAPTSGAPVPWPVREVQITTAELTLVPVRTSAGVLALPSYELAGTDAGGTEGTWTVPALSEDSFDFTG